MYLELVKQVSQVEQETEASVRQAAQQAQQMQEEAERSGRALVEQTRRGHYLWLCSIMQSRISWPMCLVTVLCRGRMWILQ